MHHSSQCGTFLHTLAPRVRANYTQKVAVPAEDRSQKLTRIPGNGTSMECWLPLSTTGATQAEVGVAESAVSAADGAEGLS